MESLESQPQNPENSHPCKRKRLFHPNTHVCLFDLIIYVPVNIFSVMLGWVFLC